MKAANSPMLRELMSICSQREQMLIKSFLRKCNIGDELEIAGIKLTCVPTSCKIKHETK